MTETYPHLRQLLGGWFHQDFDIDGDVPDIIPKYAESVDAETVRATAAEIREFLRSAHPDVGTAFVVTFEPDIEPAGWGMTAADWLGWLERLLLAEVGVDPGHTAAGP